MITLYSPRQIADLMSKDNPDVTIGEAKVREIVREEVAADKPDELRFIPGGRFHGNTMYITGGIFESVMEGRAVTRTAPVTFIDPHRRREAKTA